jgi:hypothetical protein
MAADAKAMLPRDLVAQLCELLGLKFQQLMAGDTVEMIMGWIAVIVFVDTATVEFKAPQQSRVDKFFQCAVNGGATDIAGLALAGQLVDQLVGIKVFVPGENLFDQKTPLVRFAQTAALQILFESLNG